MKMLVMMLLIILLGNSLASCEVVRVGAAIVGDKRVYQSLDLAELKKSDWNPSRGQVPLAPTKAILAANKFCNTNLLGKVTSGIWQLRLVSRKVEGVDRWYWLALYSIETDQAISGHSMLVVPVSFTGKIMVEITPMK